MVKESPNTPSADAEWYLEVEGKRTGPYTSEQVLGLYREGEILGHHLVSSDPANGQWISVDALPRVLKGSTQNFSPPPRPTDLNGQPTQFEGEPALLDPAYGLLEALKTSRERQTAAQRSSPPMFKPPKAGSDPKPAWHPASWFIVRDRLPPQAYVVAALTVVLAISVWGLIRILNRPAPSSTAPSSVAQQPPAPSKRPAPLEAPAAVAASAPPVVAPPVRFPRAPDPTAARVQAPPGVSRSIITQPPAETTHVDPQVERDVAAVPINEYRNVSGGAPVDEAHLAPPPAQAPGEPGPLQEDGSQIPIDSEQQNFQTPPPPPQVEGMAEEPNT